MLAVGKRAMFGLQKRVDLVPASLGGSLDVREVQVLWNVKSVAFLGEHVGGKCAFLCQVFFEKLNIYLFFQLRPSLDSPRMHLASFSGLVLTSCFACCEFDHSVALLRWLLHQLSQDRKAATFVS